MEKTGQRFRFFPTLAAEVARDIVLEGGTFYNYDILRMSAFKTNKNAGKVGETCECFLVYAIMIDPHESLPFHLFLFMEG